ncbi:MAG: hypothetical protein Q8Q20_04580 [bacterium]|nr:hypothetical protein [bacterium]
MTSDVGDVGKLTERLVVELGHLEDGVLREELKNLLALGDPDGRWPYPGDPSPCSRFWSVYQEAKQMGEPGRAFIRDCAPALTILARDFDPDMDHPSLFFELIPLAMLMSDGELRRALADRRDCDSLEYRGMSGTGQLDRVRRAVDRKLLSRTEALEREENYE